MTDLTTLLTNVRPWGGSAVDLELRGGVIAAIHPSLGEVVRGEGVAVVDGGGRIALPAFTDAHVHLDSTRIGLPFRPHTAEPGPLWNLIANDRAHWREAEESVSDRATTTLGRAIAHGMTRARSYAQVDADCGLERLDGVLAAREHHRDRADVQVVAFPQAGLLLEPGVPDLLDQALRSGAEVVGGIDPCGLDGDPIRHLDLVFDLAERHDVPIDIHLHEPGELGAWTMTKIVERVRAHQARGRVTIAHAFALADLPGPRLAPLLESFAEWDVAITTVAPARGTLPIPELTEWGIRIGLGQDGQRDYWSPYGTTDMLDRTWQFAFTRGLRRDELIEHSVAIATVGGASVIDPTARRLAGTTDRPGLEVEDPAEIVLVAGDTVSAAVMDRAGGRTVVHRGRVVADASELR